MLARSALILSMQVVREAPKPSPDVTGPASVPPPELLPLLLPLLPPLLLPLELPLELPLPPPLELPLPPPLLLPLPPPLLEPVWPELLPLEEPEPEPLFAPSPPEDAPPASPELPAPSHGSVEAVELQPPTIAPVRAIPPTRTTSPSDTLRMTTSSPRVRVREDCRRNRPVQRVWPARNDTKSTWAQRGCSARNCTACNDSPPLQRRPTQRGMGAILRGGCHCGNLGVVLETERDPRALPLRACQCSFCRRHGAVTTADPGGLLRIT